MGFHGTASGSVRRIALSSCRVGREAPVASGVSDMEGFEHSRTIRFVPEFARSLARCTLIG
jgi:hypothetical protein